MNQDQSISEVQAHKELQDQEDVLSPAIEKMTRDMKFVSIFTIITGILYSITIVGAIVGIPLIISGIRLRDSARAYIHFMNKGRKQSLKHAFLYQQKFFFILKLLIIIVILLFVLYFASIYFLYSHLIDIMNSINEFNGHMV